MTDTQAQEAIDCLVSIIRASNLRGAGMRLVGIRLLLEHWRWQQDTGPRKAFLRMFDDNPAKAAAWLAEHREELMSELAERAKLLQTHMASSGQSTEKDHGEDQET